ncbi:hypothetical protein [Pseudomonas cremoricolorata]|uniref:Uncharacterized protein n=1 Tax=Pseudomonas cremoricolorata TaxID=157783 RepID=A0A089WRD0_9PSED|nr:hypothetical protein [Pseudomonas cremoricolorata]AIR89714.1 hypothetical protein LK03_10620 [Pseudomonas cremoricolorata]
MASDNLGAEQYVEGRLVAVILLVLTALGAFAATTFCGERGCVLTAQAVVCAVTSALCVLLLLNRRALRAKREGRSYSLAYLLAWIWAGGATAVVLSQPALADEAPALLSVVLSSLLGGVAAAIVAHLWHEREQRPPTPRAARTPRRGKAEQALAQVKARL